MYYDQIAFQRSLEGSLACCPQARHDVRSSRYQFNLYHRDFYKFGLVPETPVKQLSFLLFLGAGISASHCSRLKYFRISFLCF